MQTLSPIEMKPATSGFHDEVVQGLAQDTKSLPCKFFYDARGSQLFDRICELEEYYPTRTEMGIMQANSRAMAALLGKNCRLVEYGSGSSLKTRILLDHAVQLASYVPVDISGEHLLATADSLARAYPTLRIQPVCADYTQPFGVPQGSEARTVVYFPGSTIGNFPPAQAKEFLLRIAQVCGTGGGLLVGVDLRKAPQILEPAYNDREGITAAFNMNLLMRINAELGANFNMEKFAHHAFYNAMQGRIEMHLVSLEAQKVTIGNTVVCFEEDEFIHTESSYKYALDEFACLAQSAGFAVQRVWTDPDNLFSVQYLTTA